MNHIVYFFKQVCELIKKYGLSNVLLSVVIGLLLFISIQGGNTEKIIEYFKKTEEVKTVNHDKGQELRSTTQAEIYNIIEKIGYKYRADRVFVGEYHNGDVNLNGMPFKYFGITYEAILNPKSKISVIAEQYRDIPATLFRFVDYVYINRFFYGTIDQLSEMDKLLSFKLKENKAGYIFIVGIRSTNSPHKDFGFFGMTFAEPLSEEMLKNIDSKKENIIFDMRYAGVDIAKLLNFNSDI